ncbi:allergen MAG29-like, partial [Stegodyphus dumicola]|uniref:allergen MAG29-like n=1 Tax=Stegodyphus dumicola TaxID=202533 RepID=UPI0015AFB773
STAFIYVFDIITYLLKLSFEGGITLGGILIVSAVDKSTGKENKITITNDKGRLSKEEIERMVKDAERYKDGDDKQKSRIAAKNSLESYAFNIKSTIKDDKLKDKISEDDRRKVLDKVNDTLKWLDSNQLAEKEEFDDKQKELESICNPIITKLFQSAGGAPGGMPGGFPGAGAAPGGGSTEVNVIPPSKERYVDESSGPPNSLRYCVDNREDRSGLKMAEWRA